MRIGRYEWVARPCAGLGALMGLVGCNAVFGLDEVGLTGSGGGSTASAGETSTVGAGGSSCETPWADAEGGADITPSSLDPIVTEPASLTCTHEAGPPATVTCTLLRDGAAHVAAPPATPALGYVRQGQCLQFSANASGSGTTIRPFAGSEGPTDYLIGTPTAVTTGANMTTWRCKVGADVAFEDLGFEIAGPADGKVTLGRDSGIRILGASSCDEGLVGCELAPTDCTAPGWEDFNGGGEPWAVTSTATERSAVAGFASCASATRFLGGEAGGVEVTYTGDVSEALGPGDCLLPAMIARGNGDVTLTLADASDATRAFHFSALTPVWHDHAGASGAPGQPCKQTDFTPVSAKLSLPATCHFLDVDRFTFGRVECPASPAPCSP